MDRLRPVLVGSNPPCYTESKKKWERADLMKADHPVAAILYVVLSVLAGVAAVFMMESLSAS